MYRMGCEHYSLCKDRVVSGPGPYGYHVTSKTCCCEHDLCEHPDGVGKGVLDKCPFLWDNYTQLQVVNNAVQAAGASTQVVMAATTVCVNFVSAVVSLINSYSYLQAV